ncbi:hypothetical protein RQP46_003377 [Phenoliferia psychrophenolica]
MPVPAVPAEIVLHILDLAASDLIEAERLPTPPAQSTNALLSTASLVSKTWRPLAQSLLLRKGLVLVSNIDSFLKEVRKRGIRPSTVRFNVGASNPTIGTPAEKNSEELDQVEDTLARLLYELSPLKELECVGNTLDLLQCRPPWRFLEIESLRFTSEGSRPLACLYGFSFLFPRRLSVHQTAFDNPFPRDRPSDGTVDFEYMQTSSAALVGLTRNRPGVEHLDLVMETGALAFFAWIVTGSGSDKSLNPSSLKSLSLTETKRTVSSMPVQVGLAWKAFFPNLTSLALHLYHLPKKNTVLLPRGITSLEILPNAPLVRVKSARAAQATIIRVADTLPVLIRLAVPNYWWGEELEEYSQDWTISLEARPVI